MSFSYIQCIPDFDFEWVNFLYPTFVVVFVVFVVVVAVVVVVVVYILQHERTYYQR